MTIELTEKFISNTAQNTVKVFEEKGGIIGTAPIPEYYRLNTNAIDASEVKTWILPVDSIPIIMYGFDPAQTSNRTLTITIFNELNTPQWVLNLAYANMTDIAGLIYYKFPLAVINGGSKVTMVTNTNMVSFSCLLQRCNLLDELGSLT